MRYIAFLLVVLELIACSTKPYPGPDKQGAGEVSGAVTGAGAGAVTGFHLGVGAGPAAFVGAGIGAVAGGIQGFATDQQEENLLALSAQTQAEREVAMVHEVLNDHYRRRMELHPTRDIFPADLFFDGDNVKLRPEARALVRELAHLNKERLPWSRLAVTSYVRASDDKSFYAKHLAEKRAREICDYMIRGGLEPRRLVPRAVIIDAPILVDPDDAPGRYNQAVELIPLDR
jgi:outer membrane protein OmpA-like peptidoglycan-associated protein